MNLDLFDTPPTDAGAALFESALADWLSEAHLAGALRRDSSVEVYEHMWAGFSTWCIGSGWHLDTLTATALADFLASRGGDTELTPRYAWRLLNLVERVLAHRARKHGVPDNNVTAELLHRHPALRYANATQNNTLPDFLPPSEAKRLVTYLSAARPGRTSEDRRWQDVRNRAAVGLMLGAGLTPGEVRALQLPDIVTENARHAGIPWKLRVSGNGNAPARETPVAGWAGRLLAWWTKLRAEQGMPGVIVFPATRASGKVWGKVSQYEAAKEVLAAAGVDASDGGSFRLRHTFALRQLRRGKSPEEVARWLGVSDPGVMARYQRVVTAPVDLV